MLATALQAGRSDHNKRGFRLPASKAAHNFGSIVDPLSLDAPAAPAYAVQRSRGASGLYPEFLVYKKGRNFDFGVKPFGSDGTVRMARDGDGRNH
jgi:hypothetical protein